METKKREKYLQKALESIIQSAATDYADKMKKRAVQPFWSVFSGMTGEEKRLHLLYFDDPLHDVPRNEPETAEMKQRVQLCQKALKQAYFRVWQNCVKQLDASVYAPRKAPVEYSDKFRHIRLAHQLLEEANEDLKTFEDDLKTKLCEQGVEELEKKMAKMEEQRVDKRFQAIFEEFPGLKHDMQATLSRMRSLKTYMQNELERQRSCVPSLKNSQA